MVLSSKSGENRFRKRNEKTVKVHVVSRIPYGLGANRIPVRPGASRIPSTVGPGVVAAPAKRPGNLKNPPGHCITMLTLLESGATKL
jgi:hypothetical protein